MPTLANFDLPKQNFADKPHKKSTKPSVKPSWLPCKLFQPLSLNKQPFFPNISGWSVLLGRKALKKASKQLREICQWPSDVPAIMSACLVSMEPDSSLRLMSDQFTPDERFGKTASHCQLSTPKDASATHILVFPTSATAQVRQSTETIAFLAFAVSLVVVQLISVLACPAKS